MPLRSSISWLSIGLSIALVACAGAKPKQVGEEDHFDLPPLKTASSDTESGDDSGSSEAASSGDEGQLNEEQSRQIEVVLKRGATKAANCAEVVPDAPRGEGEVQVTFDGQKGKVTDASVGAPFAGTSAEACIKRSFINEVIVPFSGEPRVVKHKVKLADKADKADTATPPTKK